MSALPAAVGQTERVGPCGLDPAAAAAAAFRERSCTCTSFAVALPAGCGGRGASLRLALDPAGARYTPTRPDLARFLASAATAVSSGFGFAGGATAAAYTQHGALTLVLAASEEASDAADGGGGDAPLAVDSGTRVSTFSFTHPDLITLFTAHAPSAAGAVSLAPRSVVATAAQVVAAVMGALQVVCHDLRIPLPVCNDGDVGGAGGGTWRGGALAEFLDSPPPTADVARTAVDALRATLEADDNALAALAAHTIRVAARRSRTQTLRAAAVLGDGAAATNDRKRSRSSDNTAAGAPSARGRSG